MITVPVYNQQGEQVSQQTLPASLFGVRVKPDVVHQVVVGLQAQARQVYAHTKDRGEVRGGGRKPWKQKGTGRARHGSSRSPIWRGGGITFGPTSDRNFSVKINKKVKRKALGMVLSDKATNQHITLLDTLALTEIKTKSFAQLLIRLQLRSAKPTKAAVVTAETKAAKLKSKITPPVGRQPRSILVVIPTKNEAVTKSARNIPRVKIISAASLNVVDAVSYQAILMPVGAIEILEKTFVK